MCDCARFSSLRDGSGEKDHVNKDKTLHKVDSLLCFEGKSF